MTREQLIENLDLDESATFEDLHNLGYNSCDKCGDFELSEDLIWIDSEDFEPDEEDKFSEEKYSKAIEKYSALCEFDYFQECFD